ncbi:hypothetical protein [Actinoplanes sp. M2I2]|uniref:hypothetical protein n=1 Tax=Actinoplanes sp. M2I2 TaxID=1734444 RepID=UPI002020D625|nr:hypothetical protein [Actinoplanes sp. M2I2]
MITAAATLVTAFAVTAGAQQGKSGEKAMALTHDEQKSYDTARFTLKGQPVNGLCSGVARQIRVIFGNPFEFSLSWRSAPCGRSLQHGSIAVTMPSDCEDTKFLIALAGSGRKAGR